MEESIDRGHSSVSGDGMQCRITRDVIGIKVLQQPHTIRNHIMTIIIIML